jgi:hypothetical protein
MPVRYTQNETLYLNRLMGEESTISVRLINGEAMINQNVRYYRIAFNDMWVLLEHKESGTQHWIRYSAIIAIREDEEDGKGNTEE